VTTQRDLCPNPPEETKLKILDAAAKTFGEYGYHQATMTKIAEQAGVAKGTVYWYFTSKEDLFLGLLDNSLDKLYANLEQIVTDRTDPIEKLRRFIMAYLDFFGGQSHLGKIISNGGIQGLSTEFYHKMIEWHEKFDQLNFALISQGVKAGVFRDDLDDKHMAKVLAGVVSSIGSEQLFTLEEINKEAETDLILTLFLEGISSKQARVLRGVK